MLKINGHDANWTYQIEAEPGEYALPGGGKLVIAPRTKDWVNRRQPIPAAYDPERSSDSPRRGSCCDPPEKRVRNPLLMGEWRGFSQAKINNKILVFSIDIPAGSSIIQVSSKGTRPPPAGTSRNLRV